MTATLSPHHGTHEQQPSGLWTRYRAQYEKLPPGAQMIGLQLWLPLVFVIAFCFCYIAAFHAPAPHQVPVAVVGTGAQTQSFAQRLQANSAGALSVRVEPSIGAARAAVRSGDLAAAYAPGTTSARLILASTTAVIQHETLPDRSRPERCHVPLKPSRPCWTAAPRMLRHSGHPEGTG